MKITEDYVSYEVAKLLKEKGFNVSTHAFYNPKKSYILKFDPCLIDRNAGIYVSAPTHQMAMRWLREMFHIHIRLINSSDESYKFEIYPMVGEYRCKCFEDYAYYSSYEEAVEAALKYCLKNLI